MKRTVYYPKLLIKPNQKNAVNMEGEETAFT